MLRQAQAEGRPGRPGVNHLQGVTVDRGDGRSQSQAEPGSAVSSGAGGVRSGEALENASSPGDRPARALVGNLDHPILTGPPG